MYIETAPLFAGFYGDKKLVHVYIIFKNKYVLLYHFLNLVSVVL